MLHRLALAALTSLVLAACQAPTTLPANPRAQAIPAGPTTACPEGLPPGAQCLSGQDEAGAYWWMAVPAHWSGVLLLHAHGGPELGPPRAARTAQDLQRWAVVLRAGHAWAGSSYHQGGVAVHAAAEDTESLRWRFTQRFGQPRRTIMHGQSWGASVAAIAAELHPHSYDGVLLSSGVLGGGSRSYDFRLDLRVVYQALCGNHPAADEPAYPLWQGLPLGSALTRAELAQRVNTCTGLNRPADQRSPEQQRKLSTLLRQARIPESALIGHLNWATWHFQDIAFQRTGGRNPFGNIGAVYQAEVEAATRELNQRVARYAADPAALAAFAADTDPQGLITLPVVSLRGTRDATAFVELDSVFREAMASHGNGGHLVQTYTDEAEHSYLSDAEYGAAIDALLVWVDEGRKPTPQSIAAHCQAVSLAQLGGACRFLPGYVAGPLDSRVTPRQR